MSSTKPCPKVKEAALWPLAYVDQGDQAAKVTVTLSFALGSFLAVVLGLKQTDHQGKEVERWGFPRPLRA